MCPLQIHIQTLYAEPDSPLVSNLGEKWTTGTNTVGPKKQTIQKQACPTSSSHTHQYSGANQHRPDLRPTAHRNLEVDVTKMHLQKEIEAPL